MWVHRLRACLAGSCRAGITGLWAADPCRRSIFHFALLAASRGDQSLRESSREPASCHPIHVGGRVSRAAWAWRGSLDEPTQATGVNRRTDRNWTQSDVLPLSQSLTEVRRASRIKKKTFVGKQMQQLNHIFSRGLKDGKYDISLKALKGQMKLVELSEAFQDKEVKKVCHLMGRDTSVPLKERISRFLQAERRGDETAQQLIMGTGRIHQLAFYDFQLGIFLLKHYDAQVWLRQLEDLGEILLAQRIMESSQDEEIIAMTKFTVAVLSHRFKAYELGWKKFLASHDLKPIHFRKRDAEFSVARSLRKWICDLAPSDEVLKAILQEKYQEEVPFWTSDDVCADYEKSLGWYLVDPKPKQKLPPTVKQPSKTK